MRTKTEYQRKVTERQRIISENNARRLRPGVKQPSLTVPAIPEPPHGYMMFCDGDFVGFLNKDDEKLAIQTATDAVMSDASGIYNVDGVITVERKVSIHD